MTSKVAARREVLRKTLIGNARRRIAADGLAALRARDLAADAGCAVGAIYNVFGDLNDMVLAVNAQTFQALGRDVAESLSDAGQTPAQQLIVMSQAYHKFAAENYFLWRALFDLERAKDEAAPDWYLAEMAQLFTFIHDPLAAAFPQMDPDQRALLTKALFSSVHGIVLLGLEDASAGVHATNIDEMIAVILGQIFSPF
jgi:AcrR family transcriptional regulator